MIERGVLQEAYKDSGSLDIPYVLHKSLWKRCRLDFRADTWYRWMMDKSERVEAERRTVKTSEGNIRWQN